MQEKYGLEKTVAKHLIKNYGKRAFDLAKLITENKEWKNKLNKNYPFILAEIGIFFKKSTR